MGEIQCFLVKPNGDQSIELRRYAPSAECPGQFGYHNHSVPVGRALKTYGPINSGKGAHADDPRWPTHCACGYEFVEADEWQVFRTDVYRADDGREWPIRELPPGAMYDATWYHGSPHNVGPDGIALVVMLPPGGQNDWWHVDGQANNNPAPQGWTRTGTVPNVTANPSILTKRYHGWLRDGKLVEA